MRKVRENIIASKGNQPIFPEGSLVFTPPVVPGGSYTINVAPGQIVFYDAEAVAPVGLGPGVTASDVNKLTIAVGRDLDKDGASDVLVKPFGDWLSPWGIKAASVKCPSCGIPPIVDALFRCTQSEKAYTIEVQVFDETTDNQYPFNMPAIYDYTVKVADLDCDNCTTAEVNEKLACAFIDKINGIAQPGPESVAGFKRRRGDISKKFYAARLFPNSYDFCLTSQSTTCDTCLNIQGIKGIRINGVNTLFTNTLNPADSTLTLNGQVKHIIDQINVLLAGKGTAVPVMPVGKCCDVRIQINTCETIGVTDGLIAHDDSIIATCGTSNPLDPITRDVDCPTCSATPETDSYFGIRFFLKAIQPPCDCYPPNPPIGWLSGELRVFGTKGFTGTTFRSRTIQTGTVPQNLGYEWQWREYVQQTGGSGRNFEPYIDHYGPIGLPHATERVGQVTTVCEANYCSYVIEHEIPFDNASVSDEKRYARGRTVFLIPSTDTVTAAAFEAILNPFLLSTTCPNKKALTCSCEGDPQVI